MSHDNNKPTPKANNSASVEIDENSLELLSKNMSEWFVRYRGQFYLVERLGSPLTQHEVRKIAFLRFKKRFPEVEISSHLIREVFQRTLSEVHDNAKHSVPIWDGITVCRPDTGSRLIRGEDMVSINSWQTPRYRAVKAAPANGEMFDRLLARIFPNILDRRVFKDWVAWCLQNEGDKPSWSIVLYSRKKGTGKSTLCQVISRLFGEDNTITQNSVDKLTGRFNKPILEKKLVICEEIQLKSESVQGNTLKTYITEKETSSEAKGREVEKVRQCCSFILTTNHLPLWIEPGERRFWVIDVDHEGHASGEGAEAFNGFIGELIQWMESDNNIASLYRHLMSHVLSNTFNPRSLNVNADSTPLMKQIIGGSREVQLVRLEEHLQKLGRFAVPQEELVVVFTEVLKTNQNRIRHMMPELGWRSVTVKWGGVDHNRTLWVRDGYEVANGRVRGPNGYDEPVVPEPGNEIVEYLR